MTAKRYRVPAGGTVKLTGLFHGHKLPAKTVVQMDITAPKLVASGSPTR